MLDAEREQTARALSQLADEEQERIADELHDGIAHDLTLVLFHVRALPKQPDEHSRQVSLVTIEESAERALLSIQSLLSILREDRVEERPEPSERYEGRLREVTESLANVLENAGIATKVTTLTTSSRISPSAERALADVAIEAVTNILRHAPESRAATLGLMGGSETFELVVTNAGAPKEPQSRMPSGGHGLLKASHRIEQHGGRLIAEAADGGWNLRAILPVQPTGRLGISIFG